MKFRRKKMNNKILDELMAMKRQMNVWKNILYMSFRPRSDIYNWKGIVMPWLGILL